MTFIICFLLYLKVLNLFNTIVFAGYNVKTRKLIFECKSKECQKSIAFYNENDYFVISDRENVYMKIEDEKINVSNLNVYGKIHTANFSFFENEQWKMFHLNTFDASDKSWQPSEISTCGNSPDTFLGGPCKFGSTVAYAKISNLPKHEALNIKLRVHFFDEWNNDSLFLEADKKIVWNHINLAL